MKIFNTSEITDLLVPGELLVDERIERDDALIYAITKDQIDEASSGSFSLEALVAGLSDDMTLEDVLASVARLEASGWLTVDDSTIRLAYPTNFDELTAILKNEISSIIERSKSN